MEFRASTTFCISGLAFPTCNRNHMKKKVITQSHDTFSFLLEFSRKHFVAHFHSTISLHNRSIIAKVTGTASVKSFQLAGSTNGSAKDTGQNKVIFLYSMWSIFGLELFFFHISQPRNRRVKPGQSAHCWVTITFFN